ncbi:Integral membrane sensor signal transduction histidine kinase [Thiomonas sp. X19]|uniref:HAMP domain-containing sensor histidine kinase n=1 Tax=Thiomonas sp. X19 TaxID=1050370 RepID=UPI000B64E056|nr:HAMP domain-containing sensor histidine kinase [Thiomonas sp. X19]SCC95614.1 Integral membrane sensor signal transduction histidine kinase [Thiomonas sp. X19]
MNRPQAAMAAAPKAAALAPSADAAIAASAASPTAPAPGSAAAFAVRTPLWARIGLALAIALLVQAVASAVFIHWLFFSNPQEVALRHAMFRAFMHVYGIQPSPWRRLLLSPLATTVITALVVGAVTFPLMRRLTRRLQRLQRGVQALGNLNLGARVAVEGRDEVAALAVAFNQAAGRIETLVNSHKSLLAYTSHELRTPLARLRMALETLSQPQLPGRTHDAAMTEARRDLAELDELIGTILLFSRLDAGGTRVLDVREVDLLALAAEEAARDDVEVQGDWVRFSGDERLLRHAIRNLLDNARKHAPGSPPELSVQRTAGGARISVCDRGPGVPIAEAERIFEPFVRLQGRGDGSGLGLPLVRRIARLHGGDVRYVPNPGGGACFVLDVAALDNTTAATPRRA